MIELGGFAAKTHARITFLLLALAAGMGLLSSFYWISVLGPQLSEKAEITARALADAQMPGITSVLNKALENPSHDFDVLYRELTNAVNRILLLKDPKSKDPFILAVSLEIDYSVVPFPKGAFDITHGNPESCFQTEIPLYSETSHELMGIAKLCNSLSFFDNFKKDVKRTFFIGAVITFLLLVSVWRIVSAMLKRLREADRKLAEKTANLAHAGRLSAMGEMATGIAHEINQPLSIISLAAEGLCAYFRKNAPESMEAEAARAIMAQVDRTVTIITNMRSFVRTDVEAMEDTDLRKPIETSLSFFREQFRVHNIDLFVSMPETPVMVKANPRKFEQIVVNFLSNARYAVDRKARDFPDMQKQVSVTLNSNADVKEGMLEVADNGVGMSETVKSRCLEPFYTTKPVGEGTGLGLSIAASIAAEFGMNVSVDGSEGEGAKIRVHFHIIEA